ncbi:MAG TPA: DUF4919 domain-containing protein, partial [Polyangiaceae bacterium]|nr:DUF4919 domain-containing protein [Polyangiaceae bacterium]
SAAGAACTPRTMLVAGGRELTARSWCSSALLALGCAGAMGNGPAEPSSTSTTTVLQPEPLKRKAPVRSSGPSALASAASSAQADAEYYRSWTAAPGAATPRELSQLDLRRLRRGRLYARGTLEPRQASALDRQLSDAFARGDDASVLELTSKLLADDQTDVRANMLRAVALRRTGDDRQAEQFSKLGALLLESLVRDGDGKSFETAWTAFQVKEEYAVLSSRGFAVSSQTLVENDGRQYDVLEAHSLRNPDPSGEAERFYFDVTERLKEERRQVDAQAEAR